MSNQPAHPTLLIPGPIEFDDAVLQSMSHYSESHVGAPFVAVFGETLSMLRKLFQSTDPASQPLVISGSGTLGWDLVAANLAEPGDEVLVLHTGYFADSGRAIESFKARKTPPGSYFASFKNWLPIMQNYEAKKPSYFATPSPQLIHALHTSLTQILSIPLSERFAKHKATSQKIKKAANGMTAIYLPENVKAPELLPNLLKKGVIFAGGLHKEIATKYIRVGHMGVSVMDEGRGDVEKAVEALGVGLREAGYERKE
ncbi:hypothetical protein EYC84_010611 [Monilinia fructicola]|uniref:Aminotransferase class V domain-containing protein n=1 Tax=Monilinia fructicola TaxID=38448 RepID=A0A5M9J8F8_MONFR|nr:hypothetical protein EYC84_010611 [Monilinia fructicola]